MSRPTKYTKRVAESILAGICAEGSLRGALTAPGMPAERTVYRWLTENPEFRQNYALAREVGDEVDAERMREIAFDPDIPSDQKRVMVDVLKWQMARRSPKKWGDKVQQELSGPEGAPLAGPTIITLVAGNGGGSED